MADVVKSKIRKWFGDRGFGFARPLDAKFGEKDRDVFVHARSLDPALQAFTRLDFPVMDPETGRPDFPKSPPWPEVYVEAEPSERGLRAKRVSAVAFKPGEVCTDLPVSFAQGRGPLGAPLGGPPAGPLGGGRPGATRGPQEGARRPRSHDKGGGGRRGDFSDD